MPYAYVASIDTADSFFWLLHVPGHFDEWRHHHQLKTVCIYLPFINIQLSALCICCRYWYCWFFFLTVTGSMPFWRRTPSPVENCMYSPSIYKYSIKCLMHMLQVLILLILFLTVTGSRPFWRGTPSSPVENCMYWPSIYKYSIKCLMQMLQVLILLILFSDFYRFQAILTRDAIITSWKLYVFTFHL